MNRAERRRQQREGITEKVRSWEVRPSPKEIGIGTGWFSEFDRVHTDGEFAIMIRTVETEWGSVDHVCMRNLQSTDIPWTDKQKIKNDFYGPERVAIEVFPRESELVDEAMMYHIWVLPEGMNIPFGLKG